MAADAADAGRLHQILVDAKAYWGYEPAWVRTWAGGYDIPQLRTTHLVSVAKVGEDVVAWASLIPPDATGVAVLDDLWVEPAWIGNSVGSRLFTSAREQARRLGAADGRLGTSVASDGDRPRRACVQPTRRALSVLTFVALMFRRSPEAASPSET